MRKFSDTERYQAQAETAARNKREEQRRRFQPAPLHIRPTAFPALPEDRIDIQSDFEGRTGEFGAAWVGVTRYRHGCDVRGAGTLAQLKEMRDALSREIAKQEGE